MLEFNVDNGVAVLSIDDGKANAVSHSFLDSLEESLQRALEEASAVVLAGRDGVFSAGFDLNEFKKGPEATEALVVKGGQRLTDLFTHPQPVVAACTGHAIAAGALLLLACDTRIGAAGDFKIGLNETAIGMTLPLFGPALAKARLSPRHLTLAVTQSHFYDPDLAVEAGFLDRTAPAADVVDVAIAEAARLGELPAEAYAGNKIGIRREVAETIRASFA
jgi:enoyl-CoA hydratase